MIALSAADAVLYLVVMKSEFECPKCGHLLVGPADRQEAQLGDVLSCPEHGEIGLREEVIVEASNKEFRNNPGESC